MKIIFSSPNLIEVEQFKELLEAARGIPDEPEPEQPAEETAAPVENPLLA